MIESILEERGERYGEFKDHAEIAQKLKSIMKRTVGYNKLNYSQRESLDMIAHKIARILNGDANYADSWVDIAGYSTLVVKELQNENITASTNL